jgi:hypothetical protein
MSEVFALLNNAITFTAEYVKQQFEQGIRPSQTNYKTENVMIKALFGGRVYDRVTPFVHINDVILVCDGNIYNSKKLFEELAIEPETDHDYEIIVHLYLRYGIEMTLQMLDGIFAFVLLDHRLVSPNGELNSTVYVARDRYGVKPLFMLRPNTKNVMVEYMKTDGDIFGLASNVEMLNGFERELNTIEHPDNDSLLLKGKPTKPFYLIEPVMPGTYSIFEQKFRVMASWRFIKHQIPYHMYQPGLVCVNSLACDPRNLPNFLVQEAVAKRMHGQPISVVLTGNYEGFMTAAIAADRADSTINTFSWADTKFEDSIKLVTDYVKTNHTMVNVTDAEMDKENIDPAFANETRFWLMAKKIAEVSPGSTVFLDIGIDQLEYLFETDLLDTNKDTLSSLDYQYKLHHYFKSACAGRKQTVMKIFWYHGLEVELPWLDHRLVQHLVTCARDIHFMFNPTGVYGNKLLPELKGIHGFP